MKKKFSWGFFLFDIGALCASFLIAIYYKDRAFNNYLPRLLLPFLIMFVFWVIVSSIAGKYQILSFSKARKIFNPILQANITVMAFAATFMYIFQNTNFSRIIVFGTFTLVTGLELAIAFAYFAVANARTISDDIDFVEPSEHEKLTGREKILLAESGVGVLNFCRKETVLNDSSTLLVDTSNPVNICAHGDTRFSSIINIKPINLTINPKSFLKTISDCLNPECLYIGCFESEKLRMQRFIRTYTPLFFIFFYLIDLFLNRMLPPYKTNSWIYLALTTGKNRNITEQEFREMLDGSGFKIEKEKEIDGLLYFTARKKA